MACPKISYKTGSFWALIVAIKRAKLLFIFAFQWSHDINKRFKHFLLSGRLNLARNFLCQSHERRQLSKWWNSDEQLTLKNFAFKLLSTLTTWFFIPLCKIYNKIQSTHTSQFLKFLVHYSFYQLHFMSIIWPFQVWISSMFSSFLVHFLVHFKPILAP